MRLTEEIATVLKTRSYTINNSICDTMKKFKFKTQCHRTGITKENGYGAAKVLTLLVMFPFMMMKNVHQLHKNEYNKKVEMQKDVFYRMKNNEKYSWRKLLYGISKAYKGLVSARGTAEGGKRAFILDDTTDERTGYKMENISYVYDHVKKKSVYGYKVMLMAYFDGKSTTPLDFTIHTEKRLDRKKRKAQYRKEADPKSAGGKRRKEAGASKIEQAVAMIKRAVKNGFSADYVLCDAWFTSKGFIKAVRSVKGGAMHVIAGIRNDKHKYDLDGNLFNAGEIIARLKSAGNERRCRKWNILYYEAAVHYDEVGQVKLYMCRYPGQKKWRVFISTDASLTFVDMMKTYGTRWTIEVLFRECKQYLNLGGCQSQDFDAQIADATIVFIQYTFLSYLKRIESYETLGELYRLTQQDVVEKTLAERLWILFEDLLSIMVKAISSYGKLDVAEIKNTEEFRLVKEVFTSSFLFMQMGSVDNAA